METTKKIIAFTDSVNECDCCGKSGLKGTFCVEIDGNEFYYGSTCAFKKHGFDKKETEAKKQNFETKLQWAMSLSREKKRSHNPENLTLEEIFTIIKPLAISDNKIEILKLIPSLPWKM
jgi:ribosome-binding protein aMBF1 (putative translation factor)